MEQKTWVSVYKGYKLEGKSPQHAAILADQWIADKEIKEVKLKKAFMDLLTIGCGTCRYDEAEGGLDDHCDKCCRKIATAAYEIFVTNKGTITL